MAEVKKSALELIGETPVVEISRYSKAAGVDGVNLIAKLEYLIQQVQ